MRKIKLEIEKYNLDFVYVPNRIMEPSFTNTFRDTSVGRKTIDRVYDLESSFSIKINEKSYVKKENMLIIFFFNSFMYESIFYIHALLKAVKLLEVLLRNV